MDSFFGLFSCLRDYGFSSLLAHRFFCCLWSIYVAPSCCGTIRAGQLMAHWKTKNDTLTWPDVPEHTKISWLQNDFEAFANKHPDIARLKNCPSFAQYKSIPDDFLALVTPRNQNHKIYQRDGAGGSTSCFFFVACNAMVDHIINARLLFGVSK